MQLHLASPIAARVYRHLMPHCSTIIIAGSIRRCKPEVKDIEIVANVLYQQVVTGYDLFQQPITATGIAPGWIEALQAAKVLKGQPTGRYMQIDLKAGIKLDLFMPQPADYYRILAIRTGSKDYSHKVLASAWVKKGWVGTDDGLRLMSQCKETLSGWKCQVPKPTLPPHWQSELEFFEWLQVPFKDPRDREM